MIRVFSYNFTHSFKHHHMHKNSTISLPNDLIPKDRSKLKFKNVKTWIVLAAGFSLFLIILNQISLKEFLNVFSRLRIGFFLGAIAVGVSATIIKTARFGYFFPAPGRWLRLYGSFALLRVIYYILPFNSGEIVYLNLLKKHRFISTVSEAAPTWIYLRVSDVIALTLWFIITLVFSHLTGNLFEEMVHLRWIIISISAVLVIIMFSLPFWIHLISVKLPDKLVKITKVLQLLQDGFPKTYGFSTFFRTIIHSFFIWTALIGWHVLAQFAFNTPLELWQCILASIAVYCISLIPINTPMNLGSDEATWTGVMMLAGINSSIAILMAVSIRVVSMIILSIDGLIGFSLLILPSRKEKC